MPSMLATWIPIASISAAGTSITFHASALRVMTAYNSSRVFSVSFFESSSRSSDGCGFGPRTHAAMTSGPAHGPRPASSTPATGPSPHRTRADSIVRRPADLRITGRGGQLSRTVTRVIISGESIRPHRPGGSTMNWALPITLSSGNGTLVFVADVIPRVRGVAAVVAHDPYVVLGDGDRSEAPAGRTSVSQSTTPGVNGKSICTYGSSSGLPSTRTRPWSSQHSTV